MPSYALSSSLILFILIIIECFYTGCSSGELRRVEKASYKDWHIESYLNLISMTLQKIAEDIPKMRLSV